MPEVRFQTEDLHDAMTRMLAALRLTEIPVVEFAGAFANDCYAVQVRLTARDSGSLRRFAAHARRIVGVSDLEIID